MRKQYQELEKQVAGAFVYSREDYAYLMKGVRVIAQIDKEGDIYRVNTYMGNSKTNKKPSCNLLKDKDFSMINYW